MCKIILKFGEKITADEMSAHREKMEKGAGFSWWNEGKNTFGIVKDLDHARAFGQYEANCKKSPFHLFHSRFPSEGAVLLANAQPFVNADLAFCHNGTMAADQLRWLNAVAGNIVNHYDSDSKLVFGLISKMPHQSALTILKTQTQNFVLVSRKKREIYVIGSFDVETNKENTHCLAARNEWNHDRMFMVLDFNGKCKYLEVEKPKYVYSKPHTERVRGACGIPAVVQHEGELPEWWNKV